MAIPIGTPTPTSHRTDPNPFPGRLAKFVVGLFFAHRFRLDQAMR